MTSGIGMQLFRKKSNILVDVLEALRSIGIVALSAHDAVIVMDEHKKQLMIMKKIFKDHTGITSQVTLGWVQKMTLEWDPKWWVCVEEEEKNNNTRRGISNPLQIGDP
jgi:hypothetical protein